MFTTVKATAVLFLLLCVPLAGSLHARQVQPTGSPVGPSRDPCFAQFIDDLQTCEELFCPNYFSCDKDLELACIGGAKAALEDCRKR